MIGAWEIVAIVLVVLLFVGGKKIPELMKGVGKGVKSFKDGLNGIEDDVKKNGESSGS
ncbi:MAG: twin-arginine translocase TatA/TatE family subunit [Bacteroidetes bacterium]|uniref:Sec-independent protein translocase protein TatA n=1 Tax=Candidatus Cryptobacteroides avistercoris TaxID=2840758 RepID=A0A9D9IXU0_9BACT|nr:twin-arginine translocase TatA/TatE family subunit [Candidatus Cryptobacteroides avistercoris]